MQVSILTKLEDGSFKPLRVEQDIKLSSQSMLKKPKSFFICTKSCNGTYHPVASELPDILKKQSDAKAILKNIDFDEDVHGKRFVVFKNNGDTCLLGNIAVAVKKLSK